jgi:hypothetical protein
MIRFSLGAISKVGLVVAQLDNGAAGPLPVITPADGQHHVVTITVAFTTSADGSATILVDGGFGGHDESRIRQLTSLPKRSAIFVVD